MKHKAFARAWRYLNYKPIAKWTALVAAVATGVLYVAFLLVLGLFAALMVYHGSIPTFHELSGPEQNAVLQSLKLMPPDDFLRTIWIPMKPEMRIERLKAIRSTPVDDKKAEELAKADPDQLSDRERYLLYQSYWEPILFERKESLQTVGVEEVMAHDVANKLDPDTLSATDREMVWRTLAYKVLQERVSPQAAQAVVFSKDPSEGDLTNHGSLGMVVRTRDRYYGRPVGWLARWIPWTWRAGRPNFGYLATLVVAALVLALLRFLALVVMNFAAARAVIEAALRLRRAIYTHTYRLGTLAFRAQGPNEAVTVMNRRVEELHDGMYTWMTVFFREPVKFGLLLVFALLVNFWLTLAFLIVAALVWLIGRQLAAYFQREIQEATRETAEQLTLLRESVMMMRLVKYYLMEQFNQTRVEQQLTRLAQIQKDRSRGEAIHQPLLIFLGTVAAVVLLCVAGVIVVSGGLGVPSTITLTTAMVSLYGPLTNWMKHRPTLVRGREAATAVFEFLDRPGEVGQAVGAEFLPPMSQRLEFKNVTLKEPRTGRKLLDGVSMIVQAGQRVALFGPDDSEKYALIYLIPRFLDPDGGEIRIDKHNVRWVTFESLRAQVAIVSQHHLVFNDTIANNIGCGDPSFDRPRIIEAAKVAHAHHFIQKLPKGYETVIGDMGHFLSVSEQFRIGIARAILRDPALMIVEEPTTPLDEDSKALVDDTFDRILPGRTVLFLPHRLSTIRSCDQIFLLNKGRIEASGVHRDLLASNQLYRHLQYMEFNEFAEHAETATAVTKGEVPE